MRKSAALKQFHKDNRGAGVAMVLVAIALVTILVSVLMSITMVNYQMKTTEKRSKDNFYSAEIALDQIHVGLEELASESIDAAYITAMQQYKQISNTARWNNFRNAYLVNLTNELQDTGNAGRYLLNDSSEVLADGGVYTIGLVKFLSADYAKAFKDGALTIECKTDPGTNSISITESGMVLKDLCVGYTDADGYYSEIITDIKIGFPNISFSESSVLPNVFTYSMIGDAGITFAQDATLMGSIYAGKKALASDGTADLSGIVVKESGTDLTVQTGDFSFNGKALTDRNPIYIISAGQTLVDNSCTMTLISPTADQKSDATGRNISLTDLQLWTTDIILNGSTLTSQNDTAFYVKDDTSLQKSGNALSLSGQYFGYGKGESAILLNAKNSSVNLSGLDKLLLSGNAYVSADVSLESAQVEGDATALFADPENIMLGTSLATKTDQIAFLVPSEVMGVLNGNLVVGKNPLHLKDYKEWNSGHTEASYYRIDVSKKLDILGGKSLSDYGLSPADYKTIFRKIGSENVVYVYLDFSDLGEDVAAKYYTDYKNNSANLLAYLKAYNNTVNLGSEDARPDLSSTGGILTYATSDSSVNIIQETLSSMTDDELSDYYEKQTEYVDDYSGLCSKLTTRFASLSVTEQARSVYENLVGVSTSGDPYFDLIKTKLTDGQSVVYSYPNATSPVAKAVVVNGDVKLSDYDSKYELILASGNVTVDRSFSGLIVAGGRITVNTDPTIKICSDEEVVKHLLQCQPDDTTFSTNVLVEDFFINGEAYSNAYSGIFTSESDEYLSLEGIISYVNWTKN